MARPFIFLLRHLFKCSVRHVTGSILRVPSYFTTSPRTCCARFEPPEIPSAFDGYTTYQSAGLNEKKQFIITFCGPFFTALLIVGAHYFLKSHIFAEYWIRYFLFCLMKLNIYWLIVNLAPLKPLDGGCMMEYLFTKWFGVEKGFLYTLHLGNVTALVGLSYFLINQQYVFAGLFFFYGLKNWQTFQSHPSRQKTTPFSLYNDALQSMEYGDTEKARTIFSKLIKSKDEYIQIHAREGLAILLDKEGKIEQACKILSKADIGKLTQGKWLLCKLAYQKGNLTLVTQNANDLYLIRPTFETALFNAKAFSRMNDTLLAKGWLNTALQFDQAKGLDICKVLADSAFDSIRTEIYSEGIKKNPS